jgi:phosphatidate cytidylyltransferase
MKRVLTAVVLIPLVLLVLFKAPLWLFTLVVGVVAMGAAWEYLGFVEAAKLKSMRAPALAALLIVFGTAALYDHASGATFALAFYFSLLSMLFLLAWAMRQENLSMAFPSATANLVLIPYIFWPLLTLCAIRSGANGMFLIIFLFAVVWSGDIFAYYVGRAIGKHKLAPRISPGKTWEGTVASFVGSVFVAHIMFVDNQQIMEVLYRWHIAPFASALSISDKETRLFHGILLGGSINIAAQVGDLVESLMKRSVGVKDSGTILPGHGGVLDRIDALLFAIPVLFFYVYFAPLINTYS